MPAKRLPIAFALLAMALPSLSSTATAQSSSEMLSDPTAFEVAYALSFSEFDECGDSEAGRIFRRAVIERFEHCPFSPEARVRFQSSRIENLEAMATEL